MASVWAQIDALKVRHQRELAETEEAVAKLGGGSVRIDELGRWCCSWRPRAGNRATLRVKARSGAELVDALKAEQAEHAKRTEAAKQARQAG